jgi:hypothetical protein
MEKEFAIRFFAEAISTANKIGKSFEMSRLTKIQRNQQNTSASSPEEYYRRNVMIPVLDNILTDMMHRFGKNQQTAKTLDMMMSSNTVKTCSVADFQSVKQSANFYVSIICSAATANSCTVDVKAVHGEISNWPAMWIKRQGDQFYQMPSTRTSLVTSSFTLIPNVESKSCVRFQFQSRQLKLGSSQRCAAFKPGLDQRYLKND